MYVEDVFSISGRGTVVTGKVERGTITKGSELEILGMGSQLKTTLTGIGELLSDCGSSCQSYIRRATETDEHVQRCSTRNWTVEKLVTTWVLCYVVSRGSKSEEDKSWSPLERSRVSRNSKLKYMSVRKNSIFSHPPTNSVVNLI